MMKKIIILFIGFLFASVIRGQSIKRFSINSGGGSVTNLLSTVAQVFPNSATVYNNNITFGFQQPLNVSLAVPTKITITAVKDTCGGRIYRYNAPDLTGGSTGWQWSFVGTLGSNAVVDSGSLTSQVVRMKFTSNAAAVAGDSVRLSYTSEFTTSQRIALKLINTALSVPRVPLSIVINLVRDTCWGRVYRYTAPALTGTATGWQWSFVGSLGLNAVVDSGSLTSRVVRMKFSSNAAASWGDSVRLAYTSECGNSPRRTLKLTNKLIGAPSAPISINITSVRDTCGGRVYRYSAPALVGTATGWQWSFVGNLGSNAVVDSGSLTSRVVRMKFSSNVAASWGDSVRLAYTSGCGNSRRRALKLTNVQLTAPKNAPIAPTITLVSTVACKRIYRFSTSSTLTGNATGYLWSFVGSLGESAVLDSGTLTSRVVRMSFTNTSAASMDSARVVFTSGCGYSPAAKTKLTNTILNCTPENISSRANSKVSATITQPQFNVKVYPNPSMSIFNVKIQSDKAEEVLMRIINSYGRIIDYIKFKPTEIKVIGQDLIPGLYILEINQGGRRELIKIQKF
jgi:hypothetical protein